ncbi:putative transposase [Microcystis aeruginosa TAIHU98]|uniref:Putative transposase n=1 Tax=Microcystis aeruginosa TAIHU98 TaxID=1134457 RepID=L7E4I8_MICAE|nr:putative transposase [Microcystis aeruginosa TAIHU98]
MLCAEIGVVNQPKNFGASLPGVYRQCAVAYTDFWESYKTGIPSKRYRAVGKETGQTNPIERLNNTFRQRISRLVRESLSFSKKNGESHWGTLWYFIHDYNAQQSKGLSHHHYYRITTNNQSLITRFSIIALPEVQEGR